MNPLAPFAGPGRWLHCQFHAHTTNSDGEASPAALADHYARAGFDVLAITDHHHRTEHEHDRLLVIPSSELTAEPGDGSSADILALGIEADPPGKELGSIEEAAAWTVANGGLAFLAHPYWSLLDPRHYLEAPSLCGIEVYNGGSQLLNGNGLSVEFWDAVLATGRRCPGIACDDSHYPGQDSRLAWTVVRAEPTRQSVLDALRAGAFYASAGPRIEEVAQDDDGLHVRCSPARSVSLRSGAWEGGRVNAGPLAMCWRGEITGRSESGLIVSATLRFPERAGWGRIEVEDDAGRSAWTTPWELPLDRTGGADSNWG
ncbi:MAG TPA: CehA/McbA family metallohydrolase [Gaiellales bacterium]|nr:CehA/McbA family metallohydrolase [Gaiellales bacterium]